MNGKASQWSKWTKKAIIPAVLAVSLFVPVPYYIFSPGTAEVLEPIVNVPGGHKDETGSLMLTTVYSLPAANVYYLLYGWLAPHREIMPSQQVEGNLTHEEYMRLLQHMMSSSQESAIVAAMKYVGMKVDIKYYGVVISQMLPQSKAKGILQVGDLITAADGLPMLKKEQLLNYLATKKPGDIVKIEYERDNKKATADIPLISLTSGSPNTPGRAGIGFQPMTKQKITNLLPVKFTTEDIGGPSAGLMFSLEILSQLLPGDMTKGYQIAGTGTIDLNGNVGQIGGIQHKIVAADAKGADIFFAPADVQPGDNNYDIAVREAKSIHSKMKIVPVKTLTDAVNYLKTLPPKG